MARFFSDPAIIGTVLTAIFGLLIAIFTQYWSGRYQKLQITYSKNVETPLTLSNDELSKNFKVYYQSANAIQQKDIKNGFFFRSGSKTQVKEVKYVTLSTLRLANTGRKTIINQAFRCIFPEGAKLVRFPLITTIPEYEVGPIIKDSTVNEDYIQRYTIEKFAPSQVIEIKFLTSNSAFNDFQFIPAVNTTQDVKFEQGDISKNPTIEKDIRKVIINIILFYIVLQVSPIFPLLGYLLSSIISRSYDPFNPNTSATYVDLLSPIGDLLGVIIGLPFLVGAYRPFRRLIPPISRRIQEFLKSQ